ncbi:MAG: hypothetical protein GTO63_25270, partial [Anaerolineae bacterium]|nr:hypothetical protein [Anaerolineae bacterium]NIN98026.1 hypothetical protein [Anaerolineae bacterium]NIQ80975.1 hypothetical protein [Anaerolineae bacterium]
ELPEGEIVTRFTKGGRTEIPEFRWDEWITDQEAKYPGFYQGIRDELASGTGRTEVGDAEVFLRAVDMRCRKTVYQGKYVGQEATLKRELDIV